MSIVCSARTYPGSATSSRRRRLTEALNEGATQRNTTNTNNNTSATASVSRGSSTQQRRPATAGATSHTAAKLQGSVHSGGALPAPPPPPAAWPELLPREFAPSHTHGYQGHIPNNKNIIARACYKLFGHITDCQPEFNRPFMDFRLRRDNPPKRGLRVNVNHAFSAACACLQCRHVARYVELLPRVEKKQPQEVRGALVFMV